MSLWAVSREGENEGKRINNMEREIFSTLFLLHLSRDMRSPPMWYVRPA